MSCTVSEMPSGCRLRGMNASSQSAAAAAAAAAANNGNGNGSKESVGVGAGSTAAGGNGGTTGTSTTLQGSVSATSNVLQESNAPLQRPQTQKPCCFCWCCCCSCSWAKCLAIKNADENAPTKRDLVSAEFLDGDQPTLEEIRSWGKSFDKLMTNSNGRKVFRDFLRSEFSEENILFWLACEDLKKENSPEVVEEKARLIYEDYISILSPREVSLDSRVREIVNRNMIEPTTRTFDEAQIQIYTLMHRDSYPRFLNSQKYKTLAQLQDNSNAGSKADSPT
ncbi:PREDICTED: regulator of G-protein signaling 17 isoform X1 [Drosophila arizonae]|uniref:Regulator of G-protein signaling 17 isoform X1 n=1 Tax=Drosophila arizonae TaxID=7263 RepID=A0ABM1PIZ0_DROAR|nr:PREDICTED: regulator of G-protein signaling 17 isoform X1 [Drosophila arizonae]XP_017867176.1 PREDICTED: regulator of G-protein signaling 17 isoform X1 [Drosophila arizonae]XP_017867177.1 PREDICTED: regulator of G-protein signaling 17 isoform X1 [Drosophila arizonae]